MPDIQKVTVLLADGDSLRRDGLAAVLLPNTEIEVIAGCSDGQATLDEIRRLRPQVAVIDLNLPGLHGIELVRRIRGESLGTKVVIVSGTSDDEIVREVVRAGADAYLLKNGPARHLIDAINYVRDGGQYFSPQLGRDGRNRHLLEEPPRVPADSSDFERDRDRDDRREGRARPRTADPARFRERIRQEAPRDLRDRDYDIMSEMADGIRPILDRLDEIEGRVIEMESGGEPVPEDPRGWLTREFAGTLDDSRGAGSRRDRGSGRASTRDIEADLPRMIEEAVTRRFQSMAGKLQAQIEEQHVRTIETFVKNIQVKLVQRVSALEHNMTQQADAMHQLREYNQRTEDNLGRLISGVDKLAQELPKRIAAAQASTAAKPLFLGAADESRRDVRSESRRERRVASSSGGWLKKNKGPKIFWIVVALALLIFVVVHFRSKSAEDAGADVTQGAKTGKAGAKSAAPEVVASGDTKSKLEAAKQYMDRKEYVTAEDIYKQIVESEPNNEEALKGLASVLYREDKIDESAAVLERLPKH